MAKPILCRHVGDLVCESNKVAASGRFGMVVLCGNKGGATVSNFTQHYMAVMLCLHCPRILAFNPEPISVLEFV
jgi:hypothetical protein